MRLMNRRRSEALGKALAPLRETGAPTTGSGLSYCNVRAFGRAAGEKAARVYHDEEVFGEVTASS